MRRPSGSSFGKNRSAKRRLTTTLALPAVPLRSVNARPPLQSEAQRLEVVVRDGDDAGGWRRVAVGCGPAVDSQPVKCGDGGERDGSGVRRPRDRRMGHCLLVERAEEPLAPLGRRITVLRKEELDGCHVRRVDDAVGECDRQQTARHQAGARQQHQRQRQLRGHQPPHPAVRRTLCGPGAPRRRDEVSHVRLRSVHGRRQPEDHGGRQTGHDHERQHAAVEAEVDPVRGQQRLESHREHARAQGGESQAEHPGQTGEQEAFDEKLPHDADSCCAQRHPHADLPGPARGARQEQVGAVCAGDEQHDAGGGQQHRQDGSKRAVVVLVERVHPRLESLVRVGMVCREGRSDGDEIRLRAGDRHPVRETADGSEHPFVARVARQAGRDPERLPQLRPLRKLEAGGHHADDGRRRVVDADGSAEHVRVRAVAVRPDAMSEHHDGWRARAVVPRLEVAAEQRLDPEEAKGVRRDACAEEPLGRHAGVADVHRRFAVGGDVLEARRRGAPVLKVEIRDALLAAGFVPRRQRHDAVRVVDRKTTDEDGVVHGERRAGESDAEPKSKHRGGGQPALLHEQAHRKSQVLPDFFQPPRPAGVAAQFLDLIQAAELEAGAPAGLPRRQSGPDVVGCLPLDVVVQLGVQLFLGPVRVPQPLPPAHRTSPSVASRFPATGESCIACVSIHS